jgi:hypothetical protein
MYSKYQSTVQRQRRKAASETTWRLLLVAGGSLLAALLVSVELRFSMGGKWAVPIVGLGVLGLIYLQPSVQNWLHKHLEDRRDENEKRWWREREAREARAHARTEAIRQGQISRKRRK